MNKRNYGRVLVPEFLTCFTHSCLQMYDAFEDANFMYLVLEYCSNGDLHHFLKKRGKPLPEQEGTYNTHSFYPVI